MHDFGIVLRMAVSIPLNLFFTFGKLNHPLSFSNELVLEPSEPRFAAAIENVTVAQGREAKLSCVVDNLHEYKVGWMKVDTQTILSLHKRVVTHNTRVSITHDEPRTWNLHIRQVTEADRGCYMCQINTAIMKKTTGCIDVHVPPNIVDEQTSGDINVPEGESVNLQCTAKGYPEPTIQWRRKDHKIILKRGRKNKIESVPGQWLNLTKVARRQMGAYYCIASNDVPPAVMKTIQVKVSFEPQVTPKQMLLGSPLGEDLILECDVEAYPTPITFWKFNKTMILDEKPRYLVSQSVEGDYRITMRLIIRAVTQHEMGTYTCAAANSIAQAEGVIITYEIEPQQQAASAETTSGGGWNGASSLNPDGRDPTNHDHKHKQNGLHRNPSLDSSQLGVNHNGLNPFSYGPDQQTGSPRSNADLLPSTAATSSSSSYGIILLLTSILLNSLCNKKLTSL
ncbi:unnamed protein product, partial [Meganyctiphanes norvegica]